MLVKTKKRINSRIARLEASGELKEVLIHEDFLKPKEAVIELCFRGEGSSGIVELSTSEVDLLYDELKKRKDLLKGVKVLKFGK